MFVLQYAPRVAAINALEPAMEKLTDEGLREEASRLRSLVADGAELDSVLPV